MSRNVNLVFLLGNLGADPSLRSTSAGTRVAELSLATERQWNDRNGARQSKTEWHRVVAWGPLATIVERYARKGTQVHIQGRLEYRSYEDRAGVTKWTTEIIAEELTLLGGTRSSEPQRDDRPEPAFAAGEAPSAEEADPELPFEPLPSDPQPQLALAADEQAAVAGARKRRS